MKYKGREQLSYFLFPKPSHLHSPFCPLIVAFLPTPFLVAFSLCHPLIILRIMFVKRPSTEIHRFDKAHQRSPSMGLINSIYVCRRSVKYITVRYTLSVFCNHCGFKQICHLAAYEFLTVHRNAVDNHVMSLVRAK